MNETSTTSSQRRQIANASNAQHSTGPRTEAGKASSKLNALKSGLTGRTVLLPTDDARRYEQHVAAWVEELKPTGPRESALVQAIADSHWRTDRIIALEFALFAQGRIQFADLFAEHDSALQTQLIEAHIYLSYEKQLRNLSVQEGRLRRQRDKDLKELQQLQEERRTGDDEREEASAPQASKQTPATNGFEFSDRSAAADLTAGNPKGEALASSSPTPTSRHDLKRVA